MANCKIDELISHFNRKVAGMNIGTEYKMELLGMITAIGIACEKELSIEPEPQWIPCSETVDIPDHEIMACDKYGELMFGYLAYEDEQWLCESDGCMMYDPIAWSEKPEPYREEGGA